jgi:hypothetical protein
MPDAIPQLLTLLAVAQAFCVSPHTVRSWVKKGQLRPIRLCRRLLFHPDEIRRLLAEHTPGSVRAVHSWEAEKTEVRDGFATDRT